MLRFSMPLLATGLLSLALGSSASAQFYGGSANYAPSSTQGSARGLSGMADQGANIRSFTVGGGGNSFWGNSTPNVATPWSSAYGGWIQQANSGVLQDDIARQQTYYQSKFQNQDLEQRRLQLKRAAFDEMMYEKMNTPPPEYDREQQRLNQLMRARNTPPESEIWSGEALNVLMTNVQRIEARDGVRGPNIPIDPEMVKHLNVTTTGDSRGSNEFFKTDQLPDWPVAFATDAFAADRKRIQDDIAAMVQAQGAGKTDPVKAADARKAAAGLKDRLFKNRFEVSFSDYAAALEFLSKLDDTIGTLSKPGAKNFVNGTYAAKGNTVGELIDYMLSKGLTFAKATPGYEPYYTAFYQSLSTYEIGISRLIGDQSMYMQSMMQKK